MKNLGRALARIFDEYPWTEIEKHGARAQSMADDKRYVSFVSFFQSKLPILVQARTIIMTLQHLYDEDETPADIKMKIEMIFELMDPRDQAYRWSRNCHCETCERRSRPS